MLFQTWAAVGRVAASAAFVYVGLVVLLRASGKRTLSRLNAFDLVITVSLGSAMATVALSDDVALTNGIAVLATFIGAQFAVAWLSARLAPLRRATRSEPTTVVWHGMLLTEEVRDARLAPDDVLQAVRASGTGGLEQVEAVVLETDGSLSVIPRSGAGSGDALPPPRGTISSGAGTGTGT
jgi:uncharacterized membrane protein YcaP (DUF421 family)